jgi:hypothetical protein
MRDIDRALADIDEIRGRLAAGTQFRGFGPATLAFSGVLAFVAATAQSLWPATFVPSATGYLFGWIAIACLCGALIGGQMWLRARRYHGGLAEPMFLTALQQFGPAGVSGAALTAVVLWFAPETAWILPGIWQVLVALALCGATRLLPPAVLLVAGWYLVAGLGALAITARTGTLSPWAMGLPFGVGQIGLAALLAIEGERRHDR